MSFKNLLNIGFGNYIVTSRIISIVNPNSLPMRRLREDASQEGRVVDATQGRKTRSFIITDSNHIFLSALQAETLGHRYSEKGDANAE